MKKIFRYLECVKLFDGITINNISRNGQNIRSFQYMQRAGECTNYRGAFSLAFLDVYALMALPGGWPKTGEYGVHFFILGVVQTNF